MIQRASLLVHSGKFGVSIEHILSLDNPEALRELQRILLGRTARHQWYKSQDHIPHSLYGNITVRMIAGGESSSITKYSHRLIKSGRDGSWNALGKI